MILTVGNFDGVHLGHQYLLRELIGRARARERQSVVLTFYPHPRTVLSPGTKPTYLQAIDDRVAWLRRSGVDEVVVARFNREVAALSARDFCSLLVERLRLRELVLGEGAALGRGREGTIPALQGIGRDLGFAVVSLPKLVLDGKTVSSSAIRRALAAGDLATANQMLGRHYQLKGSVVPGAERGRTIGFPTANVQVPPERALPADGVYAVSVALAGERRAGVMNIGVRPSFGGGERTIEVFLLDWAGNLYGVELEVDLVARLRPERRFASVEQLIAQIHLDVEHARTVLAEAARASDRTSG